MSFAQESNFSLSNFHIITMVTKNLYKEWKLRTFKPCIISKKQSSKLQFRIILFNHVNLGPQLNILCIHDYVPCAADDVWVYIKINY